MLKEMTLPKIGVNMTEAIIGNWLVKVGDKITSGDAIMEAETDKATQEIFASESGVIVEILREEGDTVQCHEAILLLDDGSQSSEAVSPAKQQDQERPALPVAEAAPADVVKTDEPAAENQQSPPVLSSKRLRISPLAKKIAIDMGIPLNILQPSVEGGRITKKDVLSQAEAKKAAPEKAVTAPVSVSHTAGGQKVPMSAVRKTIARRMTESSQSIPSVPLTLSVDASGMINLRDRYRQRNIKISYDAILVYSVSRLLDAHPQLNAVLDGDSIILQDAVNIGVAIDTPRGLTVTVVADAANKRLADIAGELSSLSVLAVEGKLPAEKMTGSTFTLTNLGMFGIETFVPIINPPECAILAAGAITPQFVPDSSGQPVLANRIMLTLVFDHRIIDGAPAARFLSELKNVLEMPELLL